MYRAILFDFFGVFCPDISLVWLKKNVSDYERYLDIFHEICGRSDRGELTKRDFFEALSGLTHIPAKEVAAGINNEAIINEPLIGIVKDLKAKYKLAVISNATSEWIDPIANEHNMSHLFDEIVLSASVGMTKPGKDIFEYTLNKLQIQASEAIFVDDRKVNTDAAESYGIKSLLFTDNDIFIRQLHELNKVSG
jgi:HAD superfamily hydrolase (TIGR01509 family)